MWVSPLMWKLLSTHKVKPTHIFFILMLSNSPICRHTRPCSTWSTYNGSLPSERTKLLERSVTLRRREKIREEGKLQLDFWLYGPLYTPQSTPKHTHTHTHSPTKYWTLRNLNLDPGKITLRIQVIEENRGKGRRQGHSLSLICPTWDSECLVCTC